MALDENYNAHAGSIRPEDITIMKQNQKVLRRLRENDPSFTELSICDRDLHLNMPDEGDYIPSGNDLGLLGQCIGQNSHLEELHFLDPTCVCNFSN